MFECKDNTFILKTTLLFGLILVLIFIKVHSVKSIQRSGWYNYIFFWICLVYFVFIFSSIPCLYLKYKWKTINNSLKEEFVKGNVSIIFGEDYSFLFNHSVSITRNNLQK